MSNNRKAQEDYTEAIRCNDCGTETGPFYTDPDDDDTICQDCLLSLPEQSRLDFDRACSNAVNLDVIERNGRAYVSCTHCGVDIDQFNLDDGGSSIEDATALLEADERHDCEEEEEGVFDVGERVLYAPTGQWAKVVDPGNVWTFIVFEETGLEGSRFNGDLIRENDVVEEDVNGLA